MLLRLFLLFTVVPALELWLLLELGRQIGWLATVGLVLLTGVVGATLARQQGLLTVERVRREWSAGRMPTDALLDGMLILIAGAVLLTPGILTDGLGFLLLVPATRRAVRMRVAAAMKRRLTSRLSSHRVIVVETEGRVEDRDPR